MANIVPERLTEIREDKRITQKELANLIGCSEKTIYRIENGESDGLKYAEDIAHFLCCKLDYLLGKSDVNSLSFDHTQRRVIDAIVAAIRSGNPITMPSEAWDAVFPEEEQTLYVYRVIGKVVYEEVMTKPPHKLQPLV